MKGSLFGVADSMTSAVFYAAFISTQPIGGDGPGLGCWDAMITNGPEGYEVWSTFRGMMTPGERGPPRPPGVSVLAPVSQRNMRGQSWGLRHHLHEAWTTERGLTTIYRRPAPAFTGPPHAASSRYASMKRMLELSAEAWKLAAKPHEGWPAETPCAEMRLCEVLNTSGPHLLNPERAREVEAFCLRWLIAIHRKEFAAFRYGDKVRFYSETLEGGEEAHYFCGGAVDGTGK